MGTSTSSKGPNGKTPLVPSWANEGGGAISCGIDNTLGEFRGYLGRLLINLRVQVVQT